MNKSTNLSKIKNLFLKGEIAEDGNLTFYIVLLIVYVKCKSYDSLLFGVDLIW